jgi:hypothetical protein
MRNSFGLALAVGLAALSTTRADDRTEALAVLDQAIKARGGEAALAKAATMVRKAAGQMSVLGKDVPFADELTGQFPDRYRLEVDAAPPGAARFRLLVVLNGDKAWQSTGGAAGEQTAERVKELREEGYVQWLLTLVPLKKDDFGLSPLPEVKVNGQPAVGVKVTRKGHSDVKLYFDKDSHLLVRTERRASVAGTPVEKEEVYSAYKEFDGVKMPTKLVLYDGGKKFVEITSATYRFPSRLDDSTFNRP